MLCRPLSIRPMFKSVSNRTFSCVRPRSRRTAFNLSTTCFTNKSLRLCRFILQITAIKCLIFTTRLCEGGGNFAILTAILNCFLPIWTKNRVQKGACISSTKKRPPGTNSRKAFDERAARRHIPSCRIDPAADTASASGTAIRISCTQRNGERQCPQHSIPCPTPYRPSAPGRRVPGRAPCAMPGSPRRVKAIRAAESREGPAGQRLTQDATPRCCPRQTS